ncbi:glycosyltransferase WbuB [Polynucleobacter paneuropaeus]|nr:glycosyltransferase WbuB [Polynucleobacter paneuropaeus]MBT8555588.1 glycosyltransferase WbuB [Polynucleobacter paneuropaeus]MBT8560864.1 glycosyltransferase WbuB [Polynucleobacter paneuropaeus]
MRILIYGLNFAPELTGIGKYSGEMAIWLSNRGHDVRVITAPPYYPSWSIKAGYRSSTWVKENLEGIKIWRCPLWVPSHPSGVKRLIHLASFAVGSIPIVFMQIFWRPHVVVTIEPPLFIAPAGLFLAKICRSLSILHIQDYEVDAAFDLGILKGQWLKKWVLTFEGFIMRHFDLVSTISNKMLMKALGKKVLPERLHLLPNWVDLSPFNNIDTDQARKEYCELLNIPVDSIIALYSGNMGTKQGLEILSDVAKKFAMKVESITPVYFIFCGDGAGKSLLIDQCKDLQNVKFLDLQPAEMLPKFLSMVDIHLLPQRLNVADLVMPSKVTGMLASGLPILACAKSGTELANLLDGRGIIVEPENSTALFDALKFLMDNQILRKKLGISGRIYAESNLSIDTILLNFEAKIKKMIGMVD